MFAIGLKRVAEYLRLKTYEEEGSLTIFSLFLLIMIVTTSGFAVDIMYHQGQHHKMQATLDAAVLAAASASQDADDRSEVILDYVTKAGFSASDVEFVTTDFAGETTATAYGRVSTGTAFAKMFGLNRIDSASYTMAREQVTSVEISLIIDLSSSMEDSGRLDALIGAVDDFVNVVYQIDCDSSGCSEPAPDANTTINVIPYGGTVNPGAFMAEKVGLQRWHDFNNCNVIPTSTYIDTELPYGATMQIPHFGLWRFRNVAASQDFGWCPTGDRNEILYAANHPQDVKDYVRTLTMNDGTGTDIGMKWGMALLDPTSRDEMNDLISHGTITGNTSGDFPEDHAENVLKVAVVMTDGGVTFQTKPNNNLAGHGRIRFQWDFFYDEDGIRRAWDDPVNYNARVNSVQRWGSCVPYDECNGANPPENRPLSEVELSLSKTDRNQTIRWNKDYETSDAIDHIELQCANARLAKPNVEEYTPRITVYTVNLLPHLAWTEEYLRDCATEDSNYYHVRTLDALEGAFASIAGHINNQKLTLSN